MINVLIHQKNITIVNTYAPNIRAHKHIKYILTELKGDTDSNTILPGDYNILPGTMNRASR